MKLCEILSLKINELFAKRLEKLLEFGQNAREIIPLLHSSPFDYTY